jgi:hypothetical protein
MTVTVTYHAPKGDSKVVEMGGHTFFDGKPTEIEESADNAHLIGKLKANPHFQPGKSDAPPAEPAPSHDDSYPPIDEPDDDDSKPKSHRRRR